MAKLLRIRTASSIIAKFTRFYHVRMAPLREMNAATTCGACAPNYSTIDYVWTISARCSGYRHSQRKKLRTHPPPHSIYLEIFQSPPITYRIRYQFSFRFDLILTSDINCEMAPAKLATIFGLFWIASTAYALDSGWKSAHATFYGGSDASGTMGKFKFDKTAVLWTSGWA